MRSAVLLFLAAALCGQAPVVVENPATTPATCWVYVGMPPEDVPRDQGFLTDGEAKYPFVPGDRCVRVRVENLPPGQTKLRFLPAEGAGVEWRDAVDPFAIEPHWAVDPGGAAKSSERIVYWPLGAQQPGPHFARLVERDPAHQLWHVRTQSPRWNLTHDFWATVYSGQPMVEWSTTTVYGNTANDGQPFELDLPHCYLWAKAPMLRDFATQNGLGKFGDKHGTGAFALPIHVAPSRLLRGRRIVTRGVFYPTVQRESGPVMAVYGGWDGKWFYGSLPTVPQNWQQDLAAALSLYTKPPRGSLWDARPYVQPPWAETTGEQPGFGVAMLGRAVSLGQPWFVHAMLWSCDAYAMRPTANKEPDGRPFTVAKHPKAVAFGQMFEQRFSSEDMVGWAGTGELRTWWSGYEASEQQHRDARSLHATYALTGDPLLASIVDDWLELERADVMIRMGLCGAARAAGRLLIDFSGARWAGWDGYEPLIDNMLDRIAAENARHPGEVFLLGALGEAQYGWRQKPDGSLAEWNDPNSSPIIGWQPWQQTIAGAHGCWDAWRATGQERAREWALRSARQVVDLGFRAINGRWQHTYAVNWNGGRRPPASAFDGGTNVLVTMNPAADYWDLASVELIAREEPDTALGEKARQILKDYGAPKHWLEAQWRGVR